MHTAVSFPIDRAENCGGNVFYVADPCGDVFLQWPESFQFRISADGTVIHGEPLSANAEESFRNYLLGPVLSFALARQGFEQLHSTVVVTRHGAVAFLGDSGYGKSSLAAAFLAAGDSLLTDDLLILRENGGGLLAFPGPARIKLFPEVADAVLPGASNGVPMNPQTPKRILRPESNQLCGTPVCLKAIYTLAHPLRANKATKIAIRRLPQRPAFVQLLRNCFNTRLTDPGRLARQFAFSTSVVKRVPVKSLIYPRRLDYLSQVREAILADCA